MGEIGLSRDDFYKSTLYEIDLLIAGYENKQKALYNITFTANYNATGYIKAGKKFKPLDLFNTEESNTSKINPEKKKEELDYLMSIFGEQTNKVGE